MQVPLLDLKKQYETLKNEIEQVVLKIMEEQRFILGKETVEFEKAIAEYIGVPGAVGVSSGTDAILVSLMAAGIKHGDKVATTTFSFFATAGCIARVGAIPVFCDIDEDSFNIDCNKLENILRKENIKAVIPVHLFGQMCDMDALMALKQRYNFVLIEDAAQAIGSQYKNGKKAGTFGDYGCFSFFPSKNLGCFGDGGLVVSKNEDNVELVRILRNHGGKVKYYHDYIGGNFRLDNLQSAVLLVKLKYLEDWHSKRQKNAETYNRLFRERGLEEFVKTPKALYKDSGVKNYHIFNQYVIRVKDRDNLKKHLNDNNIGCEIYYPLCFHMQKCFDYLGYKEGDMPVAERISKEVLAIPVYPELTYEQIDYVVSKIEEFYKK
jgi:dTDP-4-amino-4,6-dideoxygalactose transaminase